MRRTYGTRLQKLSVDAGFSCPNRVNRISGGCTFCNNAAFNPSYCHEKPGTGDGIRKSITQQLDEGIEFHRNRYRKSCAYLAYFQTYSNTFAPLETLKPRYEEALVHPLVKGLVISTRPDCVDDEKLDYIASLQANDGTFPFISIEYGIESCLDTTLKRVNRGHDFSATQKAFAATSERNIFCGGHIILGLPGENRQTILDQVPAINALPLRTLKLHQLQILKGTRLEAEAKQDNGEIHTFSIEEYINLVCDLLERLRPDIMIERLAGEVPPRYQAFPERSWRRDDGRLIRNEEIAPLVENEMKRRNSMQGCKMDIK